MPREYRRGSARPGSIKAGFDDAMIAALTGEDMPAADATPVNVLDRAVIAAPAPAQEEEDADPEEKDKATADVPAGHRLSPQVRHRGQLPSDFTGYLITDGYAGYQHLPGSRLASIQRCAAYVIRRCRRVTKLGPGGLQSSVGDVITILRKAHQAIEAPRLRRHGPEPAARTATVPVGVPVSGDSLDPIAAAAEGRQDGTRDSCDTRGLDTQRLPRVPPRIQNSSKSQVTASCEPPMLMSLVLALKGRQAFRSQAPA